MRDNDQAFRLVGPDAIKSPVRLMAARISLLATWPDGAVIPYGEAIARKQDGSRFPLKS